MYVGFVSIIAPYMSIGRSFIITDCNIHVVKYEFDICFPCDFLSILLTSAPTN